jgi:hypothetical protein
VDNGTYLDSNSLSRFRNRRGQRGQMAESSATARAPLQDWCSGAPRALGWDIHWPQRSYWQLCVCAVLQVFFSFCPSAGSKLNKVRVCFFACSHYSSWILHAITLLIRTGPSVMARLVYVWSVYNSSIIISAATASSYLGTNNK